MSKFIYICLLALVVDLVHCFTGQFYGFDGSPDSDYRYLRHRPRKCLKESCLTCDCYGSQCGRSRDQRILNYYYNGLFSNDRKSYIDRKIREFSINSNKTKLPRESTSFGPSEGPKYGKPVSLQPVQGFVGDDCCKTYVYYCIVYALYTIQVLFHYMYTICSLFGKNEIISDYYTSCKNVVL